MSAARNPLNICPYWVGDILVTMSEIQPAQRWPGTTWEQITDCMLRAADSTHPAGSTGGAWEVVQTVEQMPKHVHNEMKVVNDGSVVQIVHPSRSGLASGDTFGSQITWLNGKEPVQTGNAGDSQPMPIANKYTACYMWKRIG